MGSLIPPVTKYLLISLVVVSLVSSFLRYFSYLVFLNKVNQINSIENSGQPPIEGITDEATNDGRNFPGVKLLAPKLSDFYLPWLVIVGGRLTTLAHPWVFITAALSEEHVVSFIVAFATLFYGCKYCEHIWGSKELLRFLGIVTIPPNIIVYLACFVVRRHGANTLDPYIISGSTALVSGFFVAFKQLVPDYMVSLGKGRISFRVRSLPFVQLTTASCFLIFGYSSYFFLAWLGFLSAWIYLRFYRITYGDPILPFNNTRGSRPTYEHFNESSGLKIIGDASTSFAISKFFPEPLNFVTEKVSEGITLLGVYLKLFTPFTTSEIDAANARASARFSSLTGSHELISYNESLGSNPKPIHSMNPRAGSLANGSASIVTTARAEAERRRHLTMQALAVGQQELQPPRSAILPASKAGKE